MTETTCGCGQAADLLPPETEKPMCLWCQVLLTAWASLMFDPGVVANAEQQLMGLERRFPLVKVRDLMTEAREKLLSSKDFESIREKLRPTK